MGKQIFDRIKKTTGILLAVLLVVSLTASAGAACADTATTPSSDTDSNTLSMADLGTLIANILNNMGYGLDLSDSSASSVLPSNFLNGIDTSNITN
jgi:hypothetical protein